MHCFSAQMWNPPTCWLTHGVRWNCVTLESARRYALICILWLFVCMFVCQLECVYSHKCFLYCVYLCMVWAQSDQISHCPISLHVSSLSHSSRDFLPLLPNPQIPLRLLLTSHFSLFLITTLSRYSVLVSDGVCARVAGDNSSDWESQHQFPLLLYTQESNNGAQSLQTAFF